jgi:hypothetical protein
MIVKSMGPDGSDKQVGWEGQRTHTDSWKMAICKTEKERGITLRSTLENRL